MVPGAILVKYVCVRISQRSGGRRIRALNCFLLFAEDDSAQAELLGIACHKAGLSASSYFVCRDGLQVVTFLQRVENPKNELTCPTRVVTDLKMPLLDGLGVLEWVRTSP